MRGSVPNASDKHNQNKGEIMIQKRNLAIAVILSLVTCGIYTVYWFVVLTNEANRLAHSQKGTSGGMALVLTFITCGIYGLYWAYRMGENLDIAASQRGLMTQNRSVLYLILQIVLPIVGMVLMQSTINDILDTNL